MPTSPSNPAITNNNRVTLTGYAEPRSLLALYDGDEMVGMALVDNNGGWRVVSDRLADGLHVLSAAVMDLAGNISPRGAFYYVNVKAASDALPQTPISAPSEVQLGPESDTGLSGTDHVTSNYLPMYVGQAAPGSWVELVIDGIKGQFGALVDDLGYWQARGMQLDEGRHTVSVIEHNSSGNVSAPSMPIPITIDTVAPLKPTTPAIVPRSDDGIDAGQPVVHTATPVLSGMAEAGACVDLYDWGYNSHTTKIGSVVADSSGAWSIETSMLADGQHRVSVLVTDLAGNIASSDQLIINVETNAPRLSTDGGITGDQMTNVTTPLVYGRTQAHASVTLYEGSKVLGTGVADADGAWAITTASLSDGQHALVAQARDQQGNALPASGTLVLTIDTQGPLKASSTPVMDAWDDRGASSSDQITSVREVTIRGNAEAKNFVKVYVDGVEQGTRTITNAFGEWGYVLGSLRDGVHHVSVVTEDYAGNAGPRSAKTVITIDTRAPDAPATPKLASLPAGAGASTGSATNSATPRLTGSAEAGATITLYDGASRIGSAVADSQGTWNITASALDKGKHSLTVTATDVAGNTSTASAALSLTVGATPLAAPTALDLASAADKGASASDDLTSLATPILTGKAPGGAIVLLFDGGTQVGRTVANSSGAWSITTTKLADGAHQLTAVAQDTAGNFSLPSAALLVTIDTKVDVSALTLDQASDSGRSQLDGISKITTPRLSGTADSGATVAVYDGSTKIGTTVADENGAWSIVTRTLADGKHSLSAKASDAAGNTSGGSPVLSLTIDTKAPPAPIALDLLAAADSGVSATDNITRITSPVVSGKAEAYAYVELYEGAALLGAALADSGGNWKITSLAGLADGVHNLTTKATDAAGNRSTASSALKLTIDTSVPAPALLDLAAAADKGASASDDVTNLATPKVTGKADAGASVVLYDGATRIGSAVASNSGQWTITSASLSDGLHKLVAVASDVAGNVAKASDVLAITIDTKAVRQTVAPLLDTQSDSGVSNSDRITSITTPKIHGTTEAGAKVALYDGSTQVGSTTADADGAWEITSRKLAAGGHSLTVKVTDIAGNLSTSSPALAFTVDNKAPVAPTALDLLTSYDTGVSNSDNKTAITAPVISGRAEAKSIVSLYEGDKLLGSTTADSSGRWTIVSTVSLDGGVHSLKAKAADIAGNVSAASAALSVTVDSSATGLKLAGTGAADNFLLNEAAGRISVTGFAVAKDRLMLTHDYNGLLLYSAADVLALGHVVGKDLVIELGAGHEVTLVGIASLTEAAIGFA
jgi:hypothetical protein